MRTRYSALLLVLSLLTVPLYGEIYVDDNAPGDPLPFDHQTSDPNEDGSAAHPFDSVQEAIDAAVDADTIIVAPGRYLSPDPLVYDEISFKGKNIRLVSSAPTDFSVANQTILCGVIIFQGDEDPNCLLQGFNIQSLGHGGILGNGTKASVSYCIISGNGPCSATVVKDVHGRIANCLIVDNMTIYLCGVLPVISGCTEIVNCTIANNASGVGVAADESNAPTIIRNCIIYGNQGTQLALPHVPSRTSPLLWMVTYSLIQDWTESGGGSYGYAAGNFGGDPCFVQPGYWSRGAPFALIEGDYHLRSRGYRWSKQEIHGSHWYYDLSTSCAIDAGDPVDGLGEELERAPDDPEGRYAVNHAIDCGAYGGTAQASLAPNEGRELGIAGVDLRDYLPLANNNSWTTQTADGQASRTVAVVARGQINKYEVYTLRDTSAQWWRTVSCVYVDYALYMIQGYVGPGWVPDTSLMQAAYPQYLIVGSTIQATDDPFVPGASAGRPALVMRGTVAEVLAGTKFDPNQFINDSQDVIAIREKTPDGTAGEPIVLFARGLGPLLLAGQPVTQIRIGKATYVVSHAGTGGTGTTKRP